MNREYLEAHELLCKEMEKRYGKDWRKDKKAVSKIKKAAKMSSSIGQRCKFLSKKYGHPDLSIRRLFQFCQDWNIVNEELRCCKAENRGINFDIVAGKHFSELAEKKRT
jgi:hypothetical protein